LLTIEVSEAELEKRKQEWKPQSNHTARGYVNLFTQHVEQACFGADFDFLKGMSGSEVTKDSH